MKTSPRERPESPRCDRCEPVPEAGQALELLALIKACHLPLSFTEFDSLLDVVSLIDMALALGDSDLDLHVPALEVEP